MNAKETYGTVSMLINAYLNDKHPTFNGYGQYPTQAEPCGNKKDSDISEGDHWGVYSHHCHRLDFSQIEEVSNAIVEMLNETYDTERFSSVIWGYTSNGEQKPVGIHIEYN